MQLHSKQTLQHLQSRIFELLMKDETYTFEKFIDLLSLEIRDFLQVDHCGVYLLDEWESAFRLRNTYSLEDDHWTRYYRSDEISHQGPTILYNGYAVNPIADRNQQYGQFFYIPLLNESYLHGFFIIPLHHMEERDQDLLELIRLEIKRAIKKVRTVFASIEQKEKYELLYQGTSDFHASNHTDDVLQEVIRTIQRIYPQFDYYLLLSQDYTTRPDLPIKNLSYDPEKASQASAKAYLMGELQVENVTENNQSTLYAPLRGKQGVYGVLQVVSKTLLHFPKSHIDFFDLLAQDAGNALENAQLYQQSRSLNNDLQLINSSSKQLNSTMRLSDKISYMAEQIDQSFGADEVGFILFKDEKHESFDILEGSSLFFDSGDCHSFISCVDKLFVKNDEAVFIGDLSTRWDHSCPYKSLMAVPMTDHEYLDGLAIVVHRDPYYFSFESFKLLQSLVHHSTLAFANSMLHEELEKTIITDYLTKLHSRNYLDEQVEEYLLEDNKGHFLLFDIDNFKRVNDSYGHQIGDDVICQVAEIMKRSIAPSGLSARWGGEELAVYLRNISEKDAYRIADNIRADVSASTNPSVTVSCGLASWDAFARTDVKQVVKDADQALYIAKEYGKNRIIVSP
ncbi:sensor domain-containing diguanylate cyclase [Halobacillus salinus]|uniref:GGDEF domain-containing protein n=1 Tax=Halobacillus salinus TaxID=192814 RepID=A0A4Z0H0V8_9BACI|nr:sensor domain-containing diguanylate cyclase [Halobacillus salinus]TGB04043.1 GGDEF domain-containing protein [Halobacillus salinus]